MSESEKKKVKRASNEETHTHNFIFIPDKKNHKAGNLITSILPISEDPPKNALKQNI